MSMIIEKLREIHRKYRLEERITKEWQSIVCSEQIKAEVSVSPENNEKIDLLDLSSLTAYELKVSGKNPHHEFYKDLAKVLTYNEYQTDENKIKRLVFITESTGIVSLRGRIDSRFKQLIENVHNIQIEFVDL